MKTTTHTFRLTGVAAALLLAFGAAQAGDDEIAQLTRPDSFLSAGVGNWSHNRQQQGIYDGMREKGIYGLLDASVLTRSDDTGTWFSLDARNLGQDNQELGVEMLRQGDIGGSVSYQRIPRDNPLIFNTGLQGIGTANLTISGAGANALPARDVTLGTNRELVTVGFYKSLMQGLDLKITFKNEEKNGTRQWGLGSDALFTVEPIDSTTQQLDVVLNYVSERLQVSGGYAGSWFNNNQDLVMALVNGAAQPGTSASRPNPTPLTLPLDNQANQFFVNAGFSFSPTTRGTLKLSHTEATQDETLPTINLTAPNDPFVGTPSNLDGKLVWTLAEVGLSARPISDLTLSGNLRYHDLDDQTPVAGYVGNNTTGTATVHNTPHSFTTTTGKFEASYRLPQRFRVIGGIDVKKQDRSFPQFESERFVPFRADLDETTYRLQLRRSMSDTVNGAVSFLHSKRDGSGFATTEAEPSDEINPIHIADRTRNKWRLTMDWAPSPRFDVQLNVEDSRDDYDTSTERPYGLKDGSATLVSVDVHFAINDEWQLSGWLSHDRTKAKQFNGRWDRVTEVHELDRESRLEDKGDSVGVGVRGAVGEKLKVGGDLQWTRTRSSYDQDSTLTGLGGSQAIYPTSGGVTAVALPDIENKLTRLKLFAKYAMRKNADLRFDVIHERWETDDWSWSIADGSPFVYGTTTDGTSVLLKPKQTATFVGVRYIYKFQ